MSPAEAARNCILAFENDEEILEIIEQVKTKDATYVEEFLDFTDKFGNTLLSIIFTYYPRYDGVMILLDKVSNDSRLKICSHTNNQHQNIFMLTDDARQVISHHTIKKILESFTQEECRSLLTAKDDTGNDAISYAAHAAYDKDVRNHHKTFCTFMSYFPEDEWDALSDTINIREVFSGLQVQKYINDVARFNFIPQMTAQNTTQEYENTIDELPCLFL